MFATTLTLTINSVPKVLERINQDNKGSEYLLRTDLEEINLYVRHSVDTTKEGPVNRHNVFIERKVFATPTTIEKYWSVTYTLRDRYASGPGELDFLSAGSLTLLGTLDTGLTTGVN